MLLVALLAMMPPLMASTPCEPSAAVREDLARLDLPDLVGQARRDRIEEILEELLAKYPRDYFVLHRYERHHHTAKKPQREAMLARIHSLAAAHPDDSGMAVVQARTLIDYDTRKAMSLLERQTHPSAHLALLDIYTWGKFAGRNEARKQLDTYFGKCPDSLESQALGALRQFGTPESAKPQVARLRKQLEADRALVRAGAWETLWNLEFKVTPVPGHAALRKRITADAAALEAIDLPANLDRLTALLEGYKQANDQEGIQRIQDRLIAGFPRSWQAKSAIRERFQKAHPYPTPSDPEEKRQAFLRTQLAHAEDQLKRQPQEFEYRMNRFNALSELNDANPQQVAEAGRAMLEALRAGADWFSTPPFEWRVAKAFLKHKVAIAEVPAMVDDGWKALKPRQEFRSDREDDDLRDREASTDVFLKAEAARILIDAAKELGKPEVARKAALELSAVKPRKETEKANTLPVLAKFAELDNRRLDALLMYRAAMAARTPAPKGKDELAENVARLFKELGGTGAGREFWDNLGTTNAALPDGRWETPKKDMPPWELSDLSGKTWKLKSLEGKTLLINVWATWCGPCRLEHPYLERLYQKLKDRPGLLVLSLNIDDEIGMVQPYLDENKYTFPVLLAKSYVDELLPSISIPRNWIVDSSGKWRAEQIGFGHDDNWEQSMIDRMEKTKPE